MSGMRVAVAMILSLTAAACSPGVPPYTALGGGQNNGGGGDDAGPDLPCSVTQADFQGFESWPGGKYLVGMGDDPNSPHLNGIRYAYLNQKPPHGSTTWPQCTMIVKQTFPLDGGDDANPTLYAMVKQGGDFNDGGAVGWEWFELGEEHPGDDIIIWGGANPPAGCGYSVGAATLSCNGCHGGVQESDYVLGDLSLSMF